MHNSGQVKSRSVDCPLSYSSLRIVLIIAYR